MHEPSRGALADPSELRALRTHGAAGRLAVKEPSLTLGRGDAHDHALGGSTCFPPSHVAVFYHKHAL